MKKRKRKGRMSFEEKFHRFIAALLKVYPEYRKRREIAKIAGIYDVEISRFKEKIDIREWVEANPDPTNAGIRIRGDKVYKGIIPSLRKNLINLEEAKNVYLKSEGDRLRELKIAENEKLISGLLKVGLKYAVQYEPPPDDLLQELKTNMAGIVNWLFLESIPHGGTVTTYPTPSLDFYLKHEFKCSDDEIEELIKFIAEKTKEPLSTLLRDLLECQLSTKLKKPWSFQRFVRFGCVIPLLKFDISENELSAGLRGGKLMLTVDLSKYKHERISGPCPLDGERCKLTVEEALRCKKFWNLVNMQREGVWSLGKGKSEEVIGTVLC